MKQVQVKTHVFNDAATAIRMPSVRGMAAGVRVSHDVFGADRTSRQSASRAKFFVGELVGLFFILLVIGYILVVPAALAKPGAIKGLFNRMIKRTIDIIGSMVGLILTAPAWIILPVLIKLDSPGSVFYTQVRVGVNRRRGNRRYHARKDIPECRVRERRREDLMGRPFNVIKFRTMVQGAERSSGPVWARKNDPRITRLGLFLRKTRLDEIPQFINVLKGDMSLVGPRPERPKFVADLSNKVDNYVNRLDVKPGLTGLAQIENGYDSSLASVVEKVRFDLQYIRKWSVVSDIKIILKTFVVVMTGKGAC